jgi:hypothetical protein
MLKFLNRWRDLLFLSVSLTAGTSHGFAPRHQHGIYHTIRVLHEISTNNQLRRRSRVMNLTSVTQESSESSRS